MDEDSGMLDAFVGQLSPSCNFNHKMTFLYSSTLDRHKAHIYAVDSGLVTEVYSPPRVTKFAHKFGLRAGHAIDIKCCDDRGVPWDLSNIQRRNQVARLIIETEPILVIWSPMCTMFSLLQNLSKDKRDEQEFNSKLEEAMSHIRFCLQLYEIQNNHSRYYLHEHPRDATSWKISEMSELIRKFSPNFVISHMCAFGMKGSDERGERIYIYIYIYIQTH